EVNRRTVAQRTMGTVAIVEAFDVIEDLRASLGAGFKATAIDQLQFECAPEAFHGGIVITVAAATHRGDQAGLTESLTIIATGVLNSAIGVEQQVGGRTAMQKSHGQ